MCFSSVCQNLAQHTFVRVFSNQSTSAHIVTALLKPTAQICHLNWLPSGSSMPSAQHIAISSWQAHQFQHTGYTLRIVPGVLARMLPSSAQSAFDQNVRTFRSCLYLCQFSVHCVLDFKARTIEEWSMQRCFALLLPGYPICHCWALRCLHLAYIFLF